MSHLIEKKNHRIRAGIGWALICWLSTLTQGLVSSISPFCLMQWDIYIYIFFFFFNQRLAPFGALRWLTYLLDCVILCYAHLEGKVVFSQLSQPETWESLWLDWPRSLSQLLWQETERTDGVSFSGTTWILKWNFVGWWKKEVDSGFWESLKECSLQNSVCTFSIFWSGKIAYTYCS